MAHALLSPSGSPRWSRCPGSVVLTKDLPRTSSEFADEGTAAHELAAWCLNAAKNAAEFIGEVIQVDARQFEVDAEMAEYVQKYVDLVRGFDAELYVEQKVRIDHITGEADATGTSDAVVIDGDTLKIVDLKYGRGVRVDAENNEQLAMYAHGAVEQFDIFGEITHIRMLISQPRLDHVSEWSLTRDELNAFIGKIAAAAGRVRGSLQFTAQFPGQVNHADLIPGDKQCKFCDAKATCPALAKQVLETIADGFVDLDAPIAPQIEHAPHRTMDNATLGQMLSAADLVEAWVKAVRAKAESELLAGHDVPDFKLVEGRRGSRKWTNDAEAEAVLKQMRLKEHEMYDFSLISPTTAEKRHKEGVIGPRQWPKLQAIITQADGKPSVAPITDKRPALVLQASADDFDDEAALDLIAGLV